MHVHVTCLNQQCRTQLSLMLILAGHMHCRVPSALTCTCRWYDFIVAVGNFTMKGSISTANTACCSWWSARSPAVVYNGQYNIQQTCCLCVLAGTSMATPHVTGSVILLRNAFPDAKPAEVIQCMVNTSDPNITPTQPNSFISGGILNVKAAYECLQAIYGGGPPMPPPDSSPSPVSGCADCSANGLCSEADGCKCIQDMAGDYCACNTTLGFAEYTADVGDGNGPQSYCTWNIDYPKSTYVKAAVNAAVALPFSILTAAAESSNNIATCSDIKVVKSVEVDTKSGFTKCPKTNYGVLPKSSAHAVGKEVCVNDDPSVGLTKYTFKVAAAHSGKTRNKCARVLVTTTDGWSQVMTLRYMN